MNPLEQQQHYHAAQGSVEKKLSFWEKLTGVTFLAVLGFFLFRWGLEGAIHNRRVQTVPELKGKSIAGALDLLAPLNLSLLKEGAEFNAAVPIGSVLRQRPAAGGKVREGKVVRVVVSQGGETVFTPAIVGLPLRNAEMLLRQGQLALGQVTASYSLRLEKGTVLSQDPKSESSVERNSLVDVVVSEGAPPEGIVLMPDFTRKNITEATQWANSAGVTLSVVKDAGSLFPYGTILSQDPQSDAVISEGMTVKMSISGRAKDGKAEKTKMFSYKAPQGSSESLVRILLVDQHGEREIFNGLRAPGSRIELPIPEGGRARVKIFLNGILVEEKDL